jgi:hypothetical protein
MSVNDWFAYQDRRFSKEKEPILTPVESKVVPIDDTASILVVEGTPSDTFIQRMREGILDKLK